MKNLVILALASLLLFSVAAGLSVWLQQTKTQMAAEDKEKDKDAKKDKEKDKGVKDLDKEKPKPSAEKVPPSNDEVAKGLEEKATKALLKAREDRLEKRQSQMELILQDIRLQRDETDKLNKQVAADVQKMLAQQADLDAQRKQDEVNLKKLPKAAGTNFGTGTPLPPKPSDLPDPNEKKNIEKMAVMFESMAPETAAKIAQQMADGGKMGTVVKVLLQMRERAAGRLIEQIPDPALAAQLLAEMQKVKRSPVVPTAAVTPGS